MVLFQLLPHLLWWGRKTCNGERQSLQLIPGLSFRLPIAFDLLILKQRWKSFLNWCVVSLILFLVSACNNAKREWIGLAIEGVGSIKQITWSFWAVQPKASGTLNNRCFLPGALGSCGQLLLWEAGSCTSQHCFIQCLHLSRTWSLWWV